MRYKRLGLAVSLAATTSVAASLALANAPVYTNGTNCPGTNNTPNQDAINIQGGPVIGYGKINIEYWGNNAASLGTEDTDAVLSSYYETGLPGTKWWQVEAQYTSYDRLFTSQSTTPAAIEAVPVINSYLDLHNAPSSPPTQITETAVASEVDWVASQLGSGADVLTIIVLPSCNTSAGGFYNPTDNPPNWGTTVGRHQVSSGGNVYVWACPADTSRISHAVAQQTVQHELIEGSTNPQPNSSKNTWCVGAPNCDNCELGDMCQGNTFKIQSQPPAQSSPSYVTEQTIYSNEALNLSGNVACVYARSNSAMVFGIGGSHLYAEQVYADNLGSGGFKWFGFVNWSSGNNGAVQYIGRPAACSWGSGRLDAFALSNTAQMWHAWSDNGGVNVSWEPRDTLPSPWQFTSNVNAEVPYPDAVSWGAGNAQVYAFARQNTLQYALFRDSWDTSGSGWTGWQMVYSFPSGTYPFSRVSVASSNATSAFAQSFPQYLQTTELAFVDGSGNLELASMVGYNTLVAGSWTAYSPANLGFSPVDLDISTYLPGRLDVMVRDTSGNYWDCTANPGQQLTLTTPCSRWSNPGVGFTDAPGAVGLGDGRILVVGPSLADGCNGHAAFMNFWNWSNWTWWTGTAGGVCNGGFVAGMDVVSY